VQNFIFIGSVVSESLESKNQNLPFVWVTVLTIVYVLHHAIEICQKIVDRGHSMRTFVMHRYHFNYDHNEQDAIV